MTDLSLMTLSGSSKLKAVNACCINENPYSDDPFSVQVKQDRAFFWLIMTTLESPDVSGQEEAVGGDQFAR